MASGTGTTAYHLARYFAEATHTVSMFLPNIEVIAVPCVGNAEYLQRQMTALDALADGSAVRPTVLSTDQAPSRVFAKPNKDHLRIWETLREQSGIEFDLIYAPRAFEVLLSQQSGNLMDIYPTCNVIYYHCGGVEGNESQLDRYRSMDLIS